jgi:HYDIN/CFA65/VesB family protein
MRCGPLRAFATICYGAGFALGSANANAQNLLTDLGPVMAFGLNNSGQVVLSHGIWSTGAVTLFPTNFTGAAINASGQIAGVVTGTNIIGSCAIYSGGTITDLGVLSGTPDVDYCTSTGINAGGQVVGWSPTRGAVYIEGFIASATVGMTAIPGIHGPYAQLISQAFGINDSGLVTGIAVDDSGANPAIDGFIYDSNANVMTNLGPACGGQAINNSGQVIGGCLYTNGTTINISGTAINSTGQVVGSHFFYSYGRIDLNDLVSATDPLKPFVTLSAAVGINDSRLVVVNGTDSRAPTVTHAYLVQAPWINITPGSLTFASQAIGTSSMAQTVTVTNAGTTPLPIDNVSTLGDFALASNDCGASLAPGGGCSVTVKFSPTAGGDRTGKLTVVTNGVPDVVALAGTAPITATISASAATAVAGSPVKLTWMASPGSTCRATGGSATDGWIGNIGVSGTQSVTEIGAGTYQYGLTCTAESQSSSAQAPPVVVTWPVVTASLTASPTSFTAGQPTTLAWSSANAGGCSATGGGVGDNWPGTKATSGSMAVTEPFVPATPSLNLTFTITCTSSVSGQSAQASVNVVENAPPPAKSGGGGAFDLLSLFLMFGVSAVRWLRQRWPSVFVSQ